MANGLEEAVKHAALAGDVAELEQLVATHGGAAVRLDGDPVELTALHWVSVSVTVEAVRFLPASPIGADPHGRKDMQRARHR